MVLMDFLAVAAVLIAAAVMKVAVKVRVNPQLYQQSAPLTLVFSPTTPPAVAP